MTRSRYKVPSFAVMGPRLPQVCILRKVEKANTIPFLRSVITTKGCTIHHCCTLLLFEFFCLFVSTWIDNNDKQICPVSQNRWREPMTSLGGRASFSDWKFAYRTGDQNTGKYRSYLQLGHTRSLDSIFCWIMIKK